MTDEEKKDASEEVAPEAPETTSKEEVKEETKKEKLKEETSVESKVEKTETVSEQTDEEVAEEIVEEKEEAPTGPVYKTKLENFDDLKPGQTVRLHERIKDISPKGQERERIQVFEGIILGLKGGGVSRTLTIKKISKGGYAVEKIFPINSPVIAKIELVKTARVRRAKLGYLKNPKRRFKRKLKETHEKK